LAGELSDSSSNELENKFEMKKVSYAPDENSNVIENSVKKTEVIELKNEDSRKNSDDVDSPIKIEVKEIKGKKSNLQIIKNASQASKDVSNRTRTKSCNSKNEALSPNEKIIAHSSTPNKEERGSNLLVKVEEKENKKTEGFIARVKRYFFKDTSNDTNQNVKSDKKPEEESSYVLTSQDIEKDLFNSEERYTFSNEKFEKSTSGIY